MTRRNFFGGFVASLGGVAVGGIQKPDPAPLPQPQPGQEEILVVYYEHGNKFLHDHAVRVAANANHPKTLVVPEGGCRGIRIERV